MTEPVRWGVIGCAQIAVNHVMPAMAQAKLTDLVAVSSRSQEKADRVAAQFELPKSYGAYEALLADPEIEAVYIPLPNGLHAEWTIKALRAGKHVLCEKPLTANAAEAREIAQVRDETGLYCLEAFAYRFSPVVLKAMDIARSGRLGPLRFLHAVSSFLMEEPYDPANVRLRAEIGGGALYDMGCYAVNALRMLAGREPVRATALMDWSARFDVDMGGTGILDFGDGLMGTLQWGFTAPWGGPFSVIGAAGRLTGTYGWGPPQDKPAMVLQSGGEVAEIYVEPGVNGYTAEVEELSEAVRGVRAPLFGREPLDANMKAIDALYRSQRTGQAEAV